MLNVRVREKRKAKGLTQKQLAELVDVSESQISQIETGKRKPGFETLLKLGEALDCTVQDLFDDEKNPATGSDGEEENKEVIILSELSEKQRKLIKEILQLSDQEATALLPITEAFLSAR